MSEQLDDGVFMSAVAPIEEPRREIVMSSLNCFVSYYGSSIVSAIGSGIKIEGVTDLSPMLGITTPCARSVIMFLLPNKGLWTLHLLPGVLQHRVDWAYVVGDRKGSWT